MPKAIRPAGFWTIDRVWEESRKYKKKCDFKKFAPTAYKIACQKGLICSMDWLQEDRHKKRGPRKTHKYTKEIIKSIIEQHNCLTTWDLRTINEYAYKKAKENDWLADLGLVRKKHIDGYWTRERVLETAKMYSDKKTFGKQQPEAYKWAGFYGLLGNMDWMKCPTYNERRDKHDSCVYAYVDKENKVVYVGLTIDVANRKNTHKYQKNSAVRKYFGKEIPEPIILKENLTLDESAIYEDYFKKKFQSEGYIILNVAPTGLNVGSIGGISKWSSKEIVLEESRKYKSRGEFRRLAGGAYNHARINGWLEEMTWLQTPPRKVKWTHEKVLAEGRKFQYRGEFCRKSPSAYEVARENGWLEEMTWMKEKLKPANYWTKSRVFEERRKYTNKKDFNNNAKTAYLKANKMGWIKQMVWLKPLPLGHISEWTKEKIIEESKKYASRSEFALKSPTAYQYAIKDKSMFLLMPWLIMKKKPDGWWNDKIRVMEEGRKYRTRTDFAIGSYAAWKKARQKGWIDEMTWFEVRSKRK